MSDRMFTKAYVMAQHKMIQQLSDDLEKERLINDELVRQASSSRDCVDDLHTALKVMRYWYGWIDADEYCDLNRPQNIVTGQMCDEPSCEGCRTHEAGEALLKAYRKI